MVAQIKKSYPLAQQYLEKVYVTRELQGVWLIIRRDIFVESDTDKDNSLTLNEVVAAFQKLQSKITSYPAVRPPLALSREE
jgi:hypothetical protein